MKGIPLIFEGTLETLMQKLKIEQIGQIKVL